MTTSIPLEHIYTIQQDMFAQQDAETFAVGRYLPYQSYLYAERQLQPETKDVGLMLIAQGVQYWVFVEDQTLKFYSDDNVSFTLTALDVEPKLAQLQKHLANWVAYATADQPWPNYEEFCFKQPTLADIKAFAEIACRGHVNGQERQATIEALAIQIFHSPSTYPWDRTRLGIETTHMMGGHILSKSTAKLKDAYITPARQLREFVFELDKISVAIVSDFIEATFRTIFNSLYGTLIVTRQVQAPYRFNYANPYNLYAGIRDMATDIAPFGLTLLRLTHTGEEDILLPIEIENREAFQAAAKRLGLHLNDVNDIVDS